MKARMTGGSVTGRGLFYLGGLALLAGLSYALLWWVESSLRAPEPAESQAPVLTIDQFRAVRTNPAGVQEYVVEAPRLWQLPGQGGVRIEQPTLDWYQSDGRTREWRLQAEQGWGAADQQTLRLEGAVTMIRTADSGKSPMTLTTRDIVIRPAQRYAETAAPLHLITPDGELQATGVRAWLDQQRLELLSQVRGFYAPPSIKSGFALALALASPLAAALPEDRSQPIQLEASRGQIDQKTGVSVYEGNVIITQGSMRLTADTVTIYLKDDNFQRMEAVGNPANLRYKPTADKPEIQGVSKRVEYDVVSAKVIMSGGAKLTQGQDTFSGDRVEYDLKDDVVRARGAGDKGRIQFTIQPRAQSPLPTTNKKP